MKAIQAREPGGPERMELVDVPTPAPGPRQALVRLAVSGVNFLDIYHRSGAYKVDRPIMLGSEGAGTVEAVGPDVVDVAPGDRVAYAMVRGSYAEYAVVPADTLVAHLLDDKGMTAEALLSGEMPSGPIEAELAAK